VGSIVSPKDLAGIKIRLSFYAVLYNPSAKRGRVLFLWFNSKIDNLSIKKKLNGIDEVMVSVLTLSAVDCGFEPRSSQTITVKVCVASL